MKNNLSLVLRAVVLSSLLAQTTGAADVAFVSGFAARPGLYPPPSHLAPAPQPAFRTAAPAVLPQKNDGMSLARRFAIDARLLEAWLIEVLEPMPQTAAPVAWPEPAQAKPVPSVPGVAEKPADRMIVVREPGFMGAAELASAIDDILAIDYHPPVYQKVFEGNWIEGRGVRFRINFFDIYGVTSASASGFWVRLSRQPARFIPAGVPAYIRGSYPIYFHHDLARAEVEVQNTGTAPITGLQAAVRQETVTDNGQAGKPITNAVALEFPGALAPGQTASFPYQFRLEGPGNERINFEQSHLVVTSDAGVLADEAKAALVDPPNF